jgi:hypothetical protein
MLRASRKAAKTPCRHSFLYNALFEVEKEDIGPENAYPWNVKP